MKILIVDDSSTTRKVIKSIADALDIAHEEAQDGMEALEMLEAHGDEINLILLDWNMPEKNGYETLVEIRKDTRYKHIPVLMVTTEGQNDSIVLAVRAGANNYLIKPFTPQELQTKILECLGESRK